MKFFVTIFADEEGEFWQQQGEGGHLAGPHWRKSPPSRTQWRTVTTEQDTVENIHHLAGHIGEKSPHSRKSATDVKTLSLGYWDQIACQVRSAKWKPASVISNQTKLILWFQMLAYVSSFIQNVFPNIWWKYRLLIITCFFETNQMHHIFLGERNWINSTRFPCCVFSTVSWNNVKTNTKWQILKNSSTRFLTCSNCFPLDSWPRVSEVSYITQT